jgi:hypothetical protein
VGVLASGALEFSFKTDLGITVGINDSLLEGAANFL